MVLGLGGCVHLLNQWQGEQDLRDAKHLMSTGRFSASEEKTLRALEGSPQALGDEALFQMGLIYSLPNNPTADYEKSMGFFERLVAQYPESNRKMEASAWVSALNRIAEMDRECVEVQKKVRLLEQTSESREKMLRHLQDQLKDRKREIAQQPEKKLKQLQEDLEDRKREITEYLETVSQLQTRVIELESQLARFKDIDLTIEQKKRGTAP
jgi:tetratricopeptide (TPR) repeat protein